MWVNYFHKTRAGNNVQFILIQNNICLDMTGGSVTVATLRWNFEKIEFPFTKFLYSF